MNTTPIRFENAVAYKHDQLVFPAIHDPNRADCMQIGEIELLGVKA